VEKTSPITILSWFSKPFPLLQGTRLKLSVSFGIGIICFLILTSFRPFGLHGIKSITFLAGFGANAVVVLLGHLFLGPILFPNFYAENKLFFISLLNYIYNESAGKEISIEYGFFEFLYMTTLVGVFPTFLMVYIAEAVARNRNEKTAQSISIPKPTKRVSDSVTIVSENLKEPSLSLTLDKFLFAEAHNNYVTIHYLQDGKEQTLMMRLKLKSFENQLANFQQILRCHKSFVLNKNKIISIQGNARSMMISLQGCSTEIPISRSFDKSLLKTE